MKQKLNQHVRHKILTAMKQERLSATSESLTTVAYHLSIVRLSRRFALSFRYADTGQTADAIQDRNLHGDKNCTHPPPSLPLSLSSQPTSNVHRSGVLFCVAVVIQACTQVLHRQKRIQRINVMLQTYAPPQKSNCSYIPAGISRQTSYGNPQHQLLSPRYRRVSRGIPVMSISMEFIRMQY